MQKKYKNYEIKSTTHNKRWKLYKDDEELFVAPSLSDIMAYIQIDERETMDDDDGLSIERQMRMMKTLSDIWMIKPCVIDNLCPWLQDDGKEPVALLAQPEVWEQTTTNVKDIHPASQVLIDDAGGPITDVPKHTINPNVAKPLKILEYESHENKMARIWQKKRDNVKKPIVKKKTSMKMKKK